MNKVTLVGNIGIEPAVRYTPTGEPVVSFSMATNKRWKDHKTGELKQTTVWHKLVCFNSVAERAKEELSKGLGLKVEGEIRSNRWTDPNGCDHFRQEVLVHDYELSSQREGKKHPTYTEFSQKERNLKGVEELREIVEEGEKFQSDSSSHSTHRLNNEQATK